MFVKKIDVDINRPDEKSVITYVASYYHTFARMKNEMKSGRRIANVMIIIIDTKRSENFNGRCVNFACFHVQSIIIIIFYKYLFLDSRSTNGYR